MLEDSCSVCWAGELPESGFLLKEPPFDMTTIPTITTPAIITNTNGAIPFWADNLFTNLSIDL